MTELSLPSRLQDLLHGEERWWIHAKVDDLELRLRVLREREMRRAVVLEVLLTLDDVELVALLSVLLQRVQAGRADSRLVMQEMALEPVLFSELPYERMADAYRIARQEGQDAVANFFLGNPMRRNPTLQEAFADNRHLDGPLGVRRAAARSTDRYVLDRLLHDRNHRVIALLLNNPRIIERDVVKIAAARPTRPEVLQQVAQHRKWASRYAVRKALACNPYTPMTISRRLIPTLLRQDLQVILTSKELSEDLRSLARVFLG
ncbi:MAG: hypothetical protein AAFV53_20120 [Myxococcota bacterium]